MPFTESVPETTQVRAPWRAAVRTLFQGLVSFAALAPVAAAAWSNDHPEDLPAWIAGGLAISAGVTRVMALPGVEAFLRKYLPLLAAGAKD